MHLDTTQTTTSALENGAETSCPTLDQLPQRIRDVATLRGLGYSYREIGRQFNITAQAVSIMLARHRRKLKSLGQNSSLHQLSARAVNVLGRHGISSPQEARRSNLLDRLERERNCGRKTVEEIATWMGNGSN